MSTRGGGLFEAETPVETSAAGDPVPTSCPLPSATSTAGEGGRGLVFEDLLTRFGDGLGFAPPFFDTAVLGPVEWVRRSSGLAVGSPNDNGVSAGGTIRRRGDDRLEDDGLVLPEVASRLACDRLWGKTVRKGESSESSTNETGLAHRPCDGVHANVKLDRNRAALHRTTPGSTCLCQNVMFGWSYGKNPAPKHQNKYIVSRV